MGILGRVEVFNNSNEDWPQYVERHFFVVNVVHCLRQYHKSLRNLVSPEKPGEKTYDVLVAALTKPAPSEIVEWFKFHSRSCKPGESVEIFIVELRSLAEFYNFGDTLEVTLRNHITNDDAIQKGLLSEPGLDYTKAVVTATNMETAAQSVKQLRNKSTTRKRGTGVEI